MLFYNQVSPIQSVGPEVDSFDTVCHLGVCAVVKCHLIADVCVYMVSEVNVFSFIYIVNSVLSIHLYFWYILNVPGT